MYLQDPVAAGDRLHISVSYTGETEYKLMPGTDLVDVAVARNWLPFRDDMENISYRLSITLPEGFLVENCKESGKSKNNCILEGRGAGSPPGFIIRRVDD